MAQATWVWLASGRLQTKSDSQKGSQSQIEGEAIRQKVTRRGFGCASQSKEEERNG